MIALTLVADLVNLVVKLYLPSRKARKILGKRDTEVLSLNYKRSVSLVYLDPTKCFAGLLRALRRLSKSNIAKVENGIGMWISASGLFSWSGVSFTLSKRIVEYAKDVADKSDIKELLYFNLFELMHNFFAGNWSDVKEYDESLIDPNLRIGEFWHVATYIDIHGLIKIDQGTFGEAERMINKLSEIWEAYENENAKQYQYSLRIKLLLKSRKLYDALVEIDAGISFQSQTERESTIIYYLGFKTIAQILLKDVDGARESLLRARELVLRIGRIPPVYISGYLLGQFSFDLYLLEQAILSDTKSDISKYRKKASHSGKHALKNAHKNALDRTEVFRLMGLYYWLMGRQNRAIKWWNYSIREGERLGFRVESARTYIEIGKRLLEEKSGVHELNGIKADDYVEKARILFQEMDLQWDLEELDKVMTYG